MEELGNTVAHSAGTEQNSQCELQRQPVVEFGIGLHQRASVCMHAWRNLRQELFGCMQACQALLGVMENSDRSLGHCVFVGTAVYRIWQLSRSCAALKRVNSSKI